MFRLKKLFNSGFILGILVVSACSSGLFDRRISEGIIEYNIQYPGISPDNNMVDFLPDKMTMEFKKNRYITKIEAGFGTFHTYFIVDSKKRYVKQMMKLWDKKYATKLDEQAVKKHNIEYPVFHLIPLNETKLVAGYPCKKVLVIFDDVEYNSFYLYYTNAIHLDDPNWNYPFTSIDGVMMEYEITQFGVLMRFSADLVNKADIDNANFEITDDYQIITSQEMNNKMEEIFSTLN